MSPRGWVEKYPVTILQEAGWAPVPVWSGGKSRPPANEYQPKITIVSWKISFFMINGDILPHDTYFLLIFKSFYNNRPNVDIHTGSTLVARQYTTPRSILCVSGNIDTHYECYTNVDGPYTHNQEIHENRLCF